MIGAWWQRQRWAVFGLYVGVVFVTVPFARRVTLALRNTDMLGASVTGLYAGAVAVVFYYVLFNLRLADWVAFVVMQLWFTPATIGWIILAGLPIGWWACTVAARNMNVSDPGAIVWDEIVAFWLVLWLVTPAGLWAQVVAFALFRYFDAAKPGPVGWADAVFKPRDPARVQWWRAGFGILLDDLVAAFCTLLVIALWRAW